MGWLPTSVGNERGVSVRLAIAAAIASAMLSGCGVDSVDLSEPQGAEASEAAATPEAFAPGGDVVESVHYTIRRGESLLGPRELSGEEIGLAVQYGADADGGPHVVMDFDEPSLPGGLGRAGLSVGRIEVANGSLRAWERLGEEVTQPGDLLSAEDLQAVRSPLPRFGPPAGASVASPRAGRTTRDLQRARAARLTPSPEAAADVLADLRAGSESEERLEDGRIQFVSRQGDLRATTIFDPDVGAVTASVSDRDGIPTGRVEYDYAWDSDGRRRLATIRSEVFDEDGDLLGVREVSVDNVSLGKGGP
jgi:hypothetical protein